MLLNILKKDWKVKMNKKNITNINIKNQRIFEVLQTPVVTEKSTECMKGNQYIFKVLKNSIKPEIKTAVESIFNVKVKSISTLNQIGKKKRFRGKLGVRASYKKAFVCLMPGQTIDMGGRI
jgi:large subunit ribosomal protein L23